MPRNVARGSVLGIASQVWYVLAGFVLYFALARVFGPSRFGEWRVVYSMLVWFELTVRFGLTRVATKAVAEQHDDPEALVRAVYALQGTVAAAALLAALLLAGPLSAAMGDPELKSLLQLAALDVPAYAAFNVAMAVLAGQQRFERQAFGWFFYATAKLAAIGVLVYAGLGVPGALIGNILASYGGLAVTFTFWKRAPGAWKAARRLLRPILIASVPFLIYSLIGGSSIDLWLLKGMLRNNILAGWYGAAAVFGTTIPFLFSGLHRVLFPSVAKARASGNERLVGQYARQAVRLSVLVTVLAAALSIPAGRELLTLVYSQRYAPAFVPLMILMIGAVPATVWLTCAEVMLALDRQREMLLWLLALLAAQTIALILLIPLQGMDGAAWAMTLTTSVGAVALAGRLRVMLGRKPLWTLARSLLAGGVVGLGLWLVSPMPLWAIPVAYAVAGGTYLGLLLVMREADADDIGSIRQMLSIKKA